MDSIKTAMSNKYVIAGAAFAAGMLSGYILFGMKPAAPPAAQPNA